MIVGIVGLGLIGGSLAKAIRHSYDNVILGYNRSEKVVRQAIEAGCIDGVLAKENLPQCDLILIALYPQAVIDYIKENVGYIKKGAVVVDCAGVKGRICAELSDFAKGNGFHFIGGHPMAGVERSGFDSSFKELFNGASMILCQDESEAAEIETLERVSEYFLGLGFGRVTVTTAQSHDRIIAYTSQLAHLVSNAYIKSPTLQERCGFSAGSYKDLTRVAKLHPGMWTELFLENRENLLRETDNIISELQKYRTALEKRDEEYLYKLLDEGSRLKQEDEDSEKSNGFGGIRTI